MPGILVATQRMAAWEIASELHLIWDASLPGEYQEQIVYLPLAY